LRRAAAKSKPRLPMSFYSSCCLTEKAFALLLKFTLRLYIGQIGLYKNLLLSEEKQAVWSSGVSCSK
ncbi:MAG TPA: hypothetical protein P5175_10595, partial [Anaerohalosphaeraceae bacterium]|nr:hypothetical protein [Anaerohalosphaeraceae bacterium]